MELLLKRIACRPNYTIGRLFVNGTYFCDTVEDTDRNLTQSMTAEEIRAVKDVNRDGNSTNDMITAIPTGTYRVTMNIQSPKYSKRSSYAFCGGYLPRLCNVPGYDGVLIHIGNTASDSAGCILVGENKVVGQVVHSAATFRKLYKVLDAANKKNEKITIEITK